MHGKDNLITLLKSYGEEGDHIHAQTTHTQAHTHTHTREKSIDSKAAAAAFLKRSFYGENFHTFVTMASFVRKYFPK